MKNRLSVLVIFSAIFTSTLAWSEDPPAKTDEKPAAAAAPESKAEYFICKNKKNVRTMHVEKEKDGPRCVTIYTRNGIDKEVARGLNHGSCVKVAGNIRINLEKAGWTCKEVTNAGLTTSKDEP